jgi:glucosylceramidase
MKKNFFTFVFLTSLLVFAGCSSVRNPSKNSKMRVDVYQTAKDTGQRLAKAETPEFMDNLPVIEKKEEIFVDPSKTFQTVIGIGGALTDASAETFYKLPTAAQQEILTAYFDSQNGIGYSLGRTHIHSCDFSSESYTYVQDGDTGLKASTLPTI